MTSPRLLPTTPEGQSLLERLKDSPGFGLTGWPERIVGIEMQARQQVLDAARSQPEAGLTYGDGYRDGRRDALTEVEYLMEEHGTKVIEIEDLRAVLLAEREP